MCPYDLEALTADVIDEARRTHPFVAQGEDRDACDAFRPVDLDEPSARPLPPRPSESACMSFAPGGLRRLRDFVAEHAWRAGLGPEAVGATGLAVNEIATNSLRHGGGKGELRAWSDDCCLVFEVSDRGYICAPLVGRVPPAPGGGSEGGLWLANQLCDLVQICSSPDGTAILVYQDL